VQALRRKGVDARLVVFERYKLHPEADVSLDRRGGFVRRQLTQWLAFARLAPQTDVFLLGLLLHEMVSGKKPWVAPQVMISSLPVWSAKGSRWSAEQKNDAVSQPRPQWPQ
jgi:hypothetical protein